MKRANFENEANKLKDLHKGHRSRQRNLLKTIDWENCEEHIILEYLLTLTNKRRDTNPLAHQLINEFGNIANVLDASIDDLMKIKGVGEITALYLHSIPNLFKIYKKSKLKDRPVFTCAQQIFDYFGKIFNHLSHEELHILLLDDSCKLITSKKLSVGDESKVSFALKDINQSVMRVSAKNVIMIHNHPSNDPIPSVEDLIITQSVFNNLITCGVNLLDHIVTCNDPNNYYSFKDGGLIRKYKEQYDAVMKNTRKIEIAIPKYN